MSLVNSRRLLVLLLDIIVTSIQSDTDWAPTQLGHKEPRVGFYIVYFYILSSLSHSKSNWKVTNCQTSCLAPKNQFNPLKNLNFRVQSSKKNCCWCHCGAPRVICSVEGKCYKKSDVYTKSLLHHRNDLRLQERERCGEKVTHLTYCPLLKKSIWRGLARTRMKEI